MVKISFNLRIPIFSLTCMACRQLAQLCTNVPISMGRNMNGINMNVKPKSSLMVLCKTVKLKQCVSSASGLSRLLRPFSSPPVLELPRPRVVSVLPFYASIFPDSFEQWQYSLAPAMHVGRNAQGWGGLLTTSTGVCSRLTVLSRWFQFPTRPETGDQ